MVKGSVHEGPPFADSTASNPLLSELGVAYLFDGEERTGGRVDDMTEGTNVVSDLLSVTQPSELRV